MAINNHEPSIGISIQESTGINLSCYPVVVHSGSQPGKRNPIEKAFKPISIQAPNQEPPLELHSKAVPRVEAHHRVNGPDPGRNSGGRQIIKKKLKKN